MTLGFLKLGPCYRQVEVRRRVMLPGGVEAVEVRPLNAKHYRFEPASSVLTAKPLTEQQKRLTEIANSYGPDWQSFPWSLGYWRQVKACKSLETRRVKEGWLGSLPKAKRKRRQCVIQIDVQCGRM